MCIRIFLSILLIILINNNKKDLEKHRDKEYNSCEEYGKKALGV